MHKGFFAGVGQRLLTVCLLVSVLSVGLVKADNTELDKLLQLVDQRLQVMNDVALYKFAHGIAVENVKREEVVLASAIANAGKHNLQPASVDAFFRLQIKLAKQVQTGWMNKWQAQGKSPKTVAENIPDLKTDIRPKLISLGESMVKQFVLALPELHDEAQQVNNRQKISRAISSPFISVKMKHQLLAAMALIQIDSTTPSNKLQQILTNGVIRVGTTGDYNPFSYIDQDKQFAGVDIDMAKDLAASLGVGLELVQTSWPTLMVDLADDRFDVGMSGISRSLKRRRSAFFSQQYAIGGKTAIGRCDQINELNSLSKIDRSAVRVIVNPGGTNQKFVVANIKQAQVIVYPDNTTIFEQIRDQHADVMITDDIEVKLQQRLFPSLCALMPKTLLTYTEKGYLLPQDIALKEYLDGWLAQVKRDGKLERAFTRYLK